MLKLNKLKALIRNVEEEQIYFSSLCEVCGPDLPISESLIDEELARLRDLLQQVVCLNGTRVFFLKFSEVEASIHRLSRAGVSVDPKGFMRSTSRLESQGYLEMLCNEFGEDNFVATCAIKLPKPCRQHLLQAKP